MKFTVGVMLTTFGIFWSTEGAGAHWPGSDAALLGVLAFVIVVSLVFVRLLKQRAAGGGNGMKWLRSFGRFWWDFIVGDDWLVAVLVAIAIGATAAARASRLHGVVAHADRRGDHPVALAAPRDPFCLEMLLVVPSPVFGPMLRLIRLGVGELLLQLGFVRRGFAGGMLGGIRSPARRDERDDEQRHEHETEDDPGDHAAEPIRPAKMPLRLGPVAQLVRAGDS